MGASTKPVVRVAGSAPLVRHPALLLATAALWAVAVLGTAAFLTRQGARARLGAAVAGVSR